MSLKRFLIPPVEGEMDESKVKQMAREWSQLLCERGIPHWVFGSVAMLLHQCKPHRETFKDIDFLVPEDRRQGMEKTLVENGFTRVKHGNYKKDDVTIGFPNHRGLPSPTDDTAGTEIGGIRVLKLDGLIEAKRLAVESQMKRIVKRGYKSHREKSVVIQLQDFCALCSARDKQNTKSGLP